MSLSDASLRRPVAMLCLIIGLFGLGLNAYRKLGLEYLPKLDLPYITIVTVYPGASPGEIETDIAKPVEDAVMAIDGLKHVTSSCMEDVCQTLLEFNIGEDVDIAANDVREKIDMIVNDFPETVEKPKILKFDVGATPIANIALSGSVSLEELYDYADNTLRDRISVVSGVADVQVIGGAEREVNVLLDRDKLAARGLTSMDAVQTIQEGVQTIPSGRIREQGVESSVKFDAEYKVVSALAGIEIANKDNARCYLSDVGEVKMATEELRQAAFVDGKPCIAIRNVKKADANAVETVALARAAIEKLNKELPGGMELLWVSDDAAFTQATVDSTTSSILQGVLLTAFILFFFLYNIRSTFIVAVTMPLTVIIGLLMLQVFGYSLNLSTMLSLGLSVGILVTNAIVVLESIVHRLEEGDSPTEAARRGSSEVGVAVLASAGTNLVVLIPIATMGSMIGMFFRPFAIAMISVTLVSIFISFTLTPIMCAALMKTGEKRGLLARAEKAFNYVFDAITNIYAGILTFLAHRKWASALVLIGVLGLFVQSLGVAKGLGFSFVPDPDKAQAIVKLEYPTRYDLNNTIQRVQEATDIVKTIPHINHIFTTVGKVEGIIGQSSEGVYLGQLLMFFTDKTEREETIHDLLTEIRKRLDDLPDCVVTVAIPSGIGGISTPIQMEIAGDDFDTLDGLATKTARMADEMGGFVAPDTTVRIGKPELRVKPKRAVLKDLGIAPSSLGYMLRANLEGIKAGQFKEGARSYDIRVKLAEQEGKEQVGNFLMPGMPGQPVSIDNFAEVEEGVAPVQITRNDKRRIARVYTSLDPSLPLGTAVDKLSAEVDAKGQYPPGYTYRFVGQYEVMKEANTAFLEAILLACALTYLTLAAVMESFIQPFIVLVTIPLGMIGVFWALSITGMSMSMFVLLGSVMLIGIVVNNAILIMDQVTLHRSQGLSTHEAMVQAARDEFRPIVMITFAAVLGMMPLAIGRGLGSETGNQIGVASIGGILVSGFLTLLVIPVLYDFITREKSNRFTVDPRTPETDSADDEA